MIEFQLESRAAMHPNRQPLEVEGGVASSAGCDLEFEALANAIPQLCCIAAPGGSILWMNQGWYAYTGGTPDQLLGWGWRTFHDQAVLPEVLEQWRSSIQSEAPFDMVFPLRDACGAFRPFLTRVVPVRDQGGRLIRWVGTSTDISEMKRVETDLRKSNAHLDLAIEVARLGEWELDLSSLIVSCSKRHAEIFGYVSLRTEWPYTLFLGHVLPHLRPDIDRQVRDSLVTGRLEFETEIERLDGEIRWIWVRGRSMPETLEQPGRVFGTVMDITHRKRAEARQRWSEDQLRALTARLHTATEEERIRISRELHDQLGQALTGMKMDLDWIVRKYGRSEDPWVPPVRESMKVVESTIELVRRIATDLRPPMLDAFGLPAAIEWHTQEFERRTGIKASVTLPERNPDLLDSQKTALFRIFQEALTNIARHSHAKRVCVRLFHDPRGTTLSIKDDGVGFDLVQLECSHSLGILGMRERALLLGTALELESSPGHGTCVTLRVQPGPAIGQDQTPAA